MKNMMLQVRNCKKLFEAKDAFPYVSDTQQGYADEPFIPAFVCAP